MIEEIKNILFSDITPAMFLVCSFVGIMALAIKYLHAAANRDITNPKTPDFFSFKFMIKDNGAKILLNLLILEMGILVLSKFLPDIITAAGAFFFGLKGIDSFKKNYLPSQKNDKMEEYIWEYTVENEDDRVITYNEEPQTELTLEEFATNFGYELSGKSLVTEVEPPNGEDTVLELITGVNVTYIRRPIRKPKPNS